MKHKFYHDELKDGMNIELEKITAIILKLSTSIEESISKKIDQLNHTSQVLLNRNETLYEDATANADSIAVNELDYNNTVASIALHQGLL